MAGESKAALGKKGDTHAAPAPSSQPVSGATLLLSILVVEDHPLLGRTLRTYLEWRGHTVRLVRSLARARAALATGQYDVLLSDVYLSGETCLQLLRTKGPLPRKVITMSAFDLLPEEILFMNSGHPQSHLVKPFPAEDLEALLAGFAGEFS